MNHPTAEVKIRPYRDGDHDAVVRLWNEVFAGDPPRNEPTAVIRRKKGVLPELFLVSTTGDTLTGTIVAGYDGYRGWLYHLAVDPVWRGRGHGRRLVEAAEAALRRLGCPKINLQVRSTNAGVVGFYERLGFGREAHVDMGKLLSDE